MLVRRKHVREAVNSTVKVGLVRHFRVKHAYPAKWVTPDEVAEWFAGYDDADVE